MLISLVINALTSWSCQKNGETNKGTMCRSFLLIKKKRQKKPHKKKERKPRQLGPPLYLQEKQASLTNSSVPRVL